MACCSGNCEKKFECAIHCLNIEGECIVEDYSNYGSGTFTDDGCEIEHWCGKLGDYKMFEPIEKKDKIYIVNGYIYESGDEDTWIEELFEDEEQANACCDYLNITNTQKNVTFYLSEIDGFCKEDYASRLEVLLKT